MFSTRTGAARLALVVVIGLIIFKAVVAFLTDSISITVPPAAFSRRASAIARLVSSSSTLVMCRLQPQNCRSIARL